VRRIIGRTVGLSVRRIIGRTVGASYYRSDCRVVGASYYRSDCRIVGLLFVLVLGVFFITIDHIRMFLIKWTSKLIFTQSLSKVMHLRKHRHFLCGVFFFFIRKSTLCAYLMRFKIIFFLH
jgi:hypothetical protein